MKHRGEMAICDVFKTTAFRLGLFKKFEILTDRIERVSVLHPAKFRDKRSNSWRHIAIFRFSKWRPSATLDLLSVCLDRRRRAFDGLIHCAKFDWNRLCSPKPAGPDRAGPGRVSGQTTKVACIAYSGAMSGLNMHAAAVCHTSN